MAATSPTGIVVFKGNQTEILALVNPKAKWKEAERLLVAQASAQHHILPQLRLHVDLQNRVCGAKTIGKLEKDLRAVAGDNLGIDNYRVRAARKDSVPAETALLINRNMKSGELLQSTKDVIILGSVPEDARVETMRSCFVFGSIGGTVLAGVRNTGEAVIACLEVAGGAHLSIGSASAVLHLAPGGIHSRYYVISAAHGQVNVDTRTLD